MEMVREVAAWKSANVNQIVKIPTTARNPLFRRSLLIVISAVVKLRLIPRHKLYPWLLRRRRRRCLLLMLGH